MDKQSTINNTISPRLCRGVRRRIRAMGGFRRSFTLTELMVVMGVIALLGGLTVLSFRGIAADAKLASGKNTVMAALDNARSLAMKRNKIVMVVFRPRLEGSQKQYVEAVLAEYTGRTAVAIVGGDRTPVDHFAPIPGVGSRALPAGVKVGAPFFAGSGSTGNVDDYWLTQSHLPAINQSNGSGEAPGRMIAIMYATDGSTITHNSATDSARMWVDFNNDGRQQLWPNAEIDYFGQTPPTIDLGNFIGGFFEQRLQHEEVYVDVAPYLAVFDDDDARTHFVVSGWTNFATREAAYKEYITKNADRVHFNRYTGVVMK